MNKIDRVPTLKELLIARETRKKKAQHQIKKHLPIAYMLWEQIGWLTREVTERSVCDI